MDLKILSTRFPSLVPPVPPALPDLTNGSGTPDRRLAGSGGRWVPPRDPYDVSMVLGGPLSQIVRRAHPSDDARELLRR
jgi:hypothetical protein